MDTAEPTQNRIDSYAGIAQATAPTKSVPRETVADQPEDGAWGKDGFTFADLLDVINPLQHLPVISTIYRALTDDEIAPGARMVGGAIFGGPLGFASAMANTAIEEATGKDLGEHVMAMVGLGSDPGVADIPVVAGNPSPSAGSTVVAAASAVPPPVPASTVEAQPLAAPTHTPAPSATQATAPYAMKSGALADYQNTAWGALLAAQQAQRAQQAEQTAAPAIAPPPASAVERPPTDRVSAQGEIEHLTAQEFAERLMLLTRAFGTTAQPRTGSEDRSY